MKIAFFVSSFGDTNLALGTIQLLEKKGHKALLVLLTKAAQSAVAIAKFDSTADKKTLFEILDVSQDKLPEERCTPEQLEKIAAYVRTNGITHAYLGVPSAITNETPFQIAMQLEDIPVLIAYEYMYRPEEHKLWDYKSKLESKPNVHWAVPLSDAKADFGESKQVHVIGHLSIDKATSPKSPDSKKPEDIKKSLQVAPGDQLAFISSTTRPHKDDAQFLQLVLIELPKHPNMQVRLGLHPGIQDFDSYIGAIISVFQKYPSKQFKIILPSSLVKEFKSPKATIHNPLYESLFLQVDVDGSEAAFAADRVSQAAYGAFLIQAALEGKPTYSNTKKPYLKISYSSSIYHFFQDPCESKQAEVDIGLDKKTAPERCAELLCNI